jgi:hypothetical protein
MTPVPHTLSRFVLLGVLVAFPLAPAWPGEEPGSEIDLFPSRCDDGEAVAWKAFHEEPGVKAEDVWTFRDGVVVCQGSPIGYIRTEQDFTDFALRLEWRRPKGKKPGRGGVLVRMTGNDKIWPKSLEAQLNAGAAGDFWGLDGYELAGPEERTTSVEHPKFGKLTNVKKIKDAEKPPGQWNQYEIIAQGGVVTLKINGQEVNRATGCDVVAGKICLTAEGDEIHFRNVRLAPIKKRKP